MSFLNSIALWGLLAISLPIILHFWNGKRGKTIAWAAMDFLQISENRVSKGIKFENLLVLLLRVAMIILLVMILAKAFWNSDSIKSDLKIAHVINGDKALWDEFRFEIQQALENEELVFLASDPPQLIESTTSLFEREVLVAQNLQATLDILPAELDSLVIYLPNSSLDHNFFLSSIRPNFQISSQENSPFPSSIQTTENVILKAGPSGILLPQTVKSTDSMNLDFSERSINVSMEIREEEKQTVRAALASISEVYGFSFKESEGLDSAQIVFTNQKIENLDSEKLYFISGVSDYVTEKNELVFADYFTYSTSEKVRQGQLPELILEEFLEFSGLDKKSGPLDPKSLEQRFLVREDSDTEKAKADEWLWVLLLGTLICERYLALKKGI